MARRSKTVDWKTVKRRLDKATRATEAAIHPSPERLRRMLEDRTRMFADAMERAPSANMVILVPFAVAGARFAISARYVREVLPLPAVTPVPRTPSHLVGVIDLRGQLLPVFDLANLLNLPAGLPGESPRILACGVGKAEFGILADEVTGIETMRSQEMRAAVAHSVRGGPPWTRGKDRNGRTVIDGAALLEDARLFIQ